MKDEHVKPIAEIASRAPMRFERKEELVGMVWDGSEESTEALKAFCGTKMLENNWPVKKAPTKVERFDRRLGHVAYIRHIANPSNIAWLEVYQGDVVYTKDIDLPPNRRNFDVASFPTFLDRWTAMIGEQA